MLVFCAELSKEEALVERRCCVVVQTSRDGTRRCIQTWIGQVTVVVTVPQS